MYNHRACDMYLPGSDVPQSAVYLVLELLYLSECQGLKLLPHEIPWISIRQVWADEGPIIHISLIYETCRVNRSFYLASAHVFSEIAWLIRYISKFIKLLFLTAVFLSVIICNLFIILKKLFATCYLWLFCRASSLDLNLMWS